MCQDLEILNRQCSQLMEHFDTVQIFVTRHENEEEHTVSCNKGDGNWYARFGQVKEWITKREREMQIEMENE